MMREPYDLRPLERRLIQAAQAEINAASQNNSPAKQQSEEQKLQDPPQAVNKMPPFKDEHILVSSKACLHLLHFHLSKAHLDTRILILTGRSLRLDHKQLSPNLAYQSLSLQRNTAFRRACFQQQKLENGSLQRSVRRNPSLPMTPQPAQMPLQLQQMSQ